MAGVHVALRKRGFLFKVALFFFLIVYIIVVIFLLNNTRINSVLNTDDRSVNFRQGSRLSDLTRVTRKEFMSGIDVSVMMLQKTWPDSVRGMRGDDAFNSSDHKELLTNLDTFTHRNYGNQSIFSKNKNESQNAIEAIASKNITIVTDSLTKRLDDLAKGCHGDTCTPFWREVDGLVDRHSLYPDHLEVYSVLDMLRTAKITEVTPFIGNSSYKWLVILEGGKKALFKVELEHPGDEKKPSCVTGFEGPKYEVAAFHLYRIAGSRNAPFAAGRIVDIRNEIYPLAPEAIRRKFMMYDDGRVCIIHKCPHCKVMRHLCFHDGRVRGAMIYWVNKPLELIKGPESMYHPFHQHSGNNRFTKYGFNDRRHCDYVRTIMPFDDPAHFLNMVDISVLNYVMANFDEKYIRISGEDSDFLFHIDHGMGYCFTDARFMNISLAILYQCCTIRLRLVQQIQRIDDAIRTNTFNQLTRRDALFPLLTQLQLNRTRDRITDVMNHVKRCRQESSPELVVLADDVMLDKALTSY